MVGQELLDFHARNILLLTEGGPGGKAARESRDLDFRLFHSLEPGLVQTAGFSGEAPGSAGTPARPDEGFRTSLSERQSTGYLDGCTVRGTARWFRVRCNQAATRL